MAWLDKSIISTIGSLINSAKVAAARSPFGKLCIFSNLTMLEMLRISVTDDIVGGCVLRKRPAVALTTGRG
jgi:hypothetical protein